MPTIAISLGDPAGIGPEVTFKALAAGRGKLPAGARFLLFGPASAAALARDFGLPELAFTDAESFRDSGARLGIVASPVPLTPSGPAAGKIGARTGPVGKRTILRDTRSDRPVAEKASRTGRTAASPGRRGQDGTGCSPQGSADGASVQLRPGRPGPSREGGAVSYEAVVAAARACLAGYADALVTAPISKESWAMAGKGCRGHTELLGEICGVGRPVMMLEGGGLRVALATTHVPIRKVPGALSPEGILAVLKVLRRGLRGLYGIGRPRIGVLALNPHAGEGGKTGREEISVIGPAIAAARRAGIAAEGPLPGDAAFHWMLNGRYDAILAMYHDQGLAPLKTLAFNEGVNVTLGLPIIRTSPDHGTAFDIAGRGIADPRSMTAAIGKALEFVRVRAASGAGGRRDPAASGYR